MRVLSRNSTEESFAIGSNVKEFKLQDTSLTSRRAKKSTNYQRVWALYAFIPCQIRLFEYLQLFEIVPVHFSPKGIGYLFNPVITP